VVDATFTETYSIPTPTPTPTNTVTPTPIGPCVKPSTGLTTYQLIRSVEVLGEQYIFYTGTTTNAGNVYNLYKYYTSQGIGYETVDIATIAIGNRVYLNDPYFTNCECATNGKYWLFDSSFINSNDPNVKIVTIVDCIITDITDWTYSEPTPTNTPTNTVTSTPTSTPTLIGAAFIDVLYQNDFTDSYDFRLYQSTSGVIGNGSYISISAVNNLRHIPTTSTSATTSYLIAGVAASISDSQFTRFYRFGINTKLLRTDYPSINLFTFNMYGARTTYNQTGTFNVRNSIKHQDIIDQPVANGVDFNVTNTENESIVINGLKICDIPNTYIQVGYFTYNASNDTIIFTDLTDHNCTPISP
jgi:hypothetical protein